MLSLRYHCLRRDILSSSGHQSVFLREFILMLLAASDNVPSLSRCLDRCIIAELDEIFFDRMYHRFEHIETFLGISRSRILTAQPSDTDTASQLIHSIDMIHPLVVHYPYEKHTLNFPEPVYTDLLFLGLIQLLKIFIQSGFQAGFIHICQRFLIEIKGLKSRGNLSQALVKSIKIPLFSEL